MWIILVITVQLFVAVYGSPTNGSDTRHGNAWNSLAELEPISDEDAKRFLQRFGYIPREVNLSEPYDKLKHSIRKFQNFTGLQSTGHLNPTTRRKMAAPRCGHPDFGPVNQVVLKWQKLKLRYGFINFSPNLSQNEIRIAIRQAFDAWTEVTPLKFEEVNINNGPEIKISFARGDHNDNNPFDGPGGILAHAFFPSAGDLHFDEDENWSYQKDRQILGNMYDIFAVGIHEIGHLLGIQHLPNPKALMGAFYIHPHDDRGMYVKPRLTPDDIRAIHQIYGPRTDGRPPKGNVPVSPNGGKPGGNVPSNPNRGKCPKKIDAFAPGMQQNVSYFFRNHTVFEVHGQRVVRRHPLAILFSGAPDSVNAAYRTAHGISLVKGDTIYPFEYDRNRRNFLPAHPEIRVGFAVNGAWNWSNRQEILLSGDQFFFYDSNYNMITFSGSLATYFPGFPSDAKGAVEENPNGGIIMVVTPKKIVRYDTRRYLVLGKKSISRTLQC